MSRTSKSVIRDLENGLLPDELNFTKPQNEQIDWAKVFDNSFYKRRELFESKFPSGMRDLPGFDAIIDIMVENAVSPLEEMRERQWDAEQIRLEKELQIGIDNSRGLYIDYVQNYVPPCEEIIADNVIDGQIQTETSI